MPFRIQYTDATHLLFGACAALLPSNLPTHRLPVTVWCLWISLQWLPSFSHVRAAEPMVSVVIGNWLPAEGGPAVSTSSPLKSPFGVDFDSHGNMLIVELEGGRVHRFTSTGELSLVAGDGSQSYRGDGGPARNATFNGMHNVTVAPNNDIYISDSWNHCIRKIDGVTSVITTIAGRGRPGYGGDGGPASAALFDYLMCVTLNSSNTELLIADLRNRRIRAISLVTDKVRTVAGNGSKGAPQDGSKAVKSPLIDPRAVAADSSGRVYILERGGHALRVVSQDGRVKTVAGNGAPGYHDGRGPEAQFNSPKHLAVDSQDNVYIADDQNAAIRKYDPATHLVTTVIGRGKGQPAVRLQRPHGVCVEDGDLYVVDTGHDRILRVHLSDRDAGTRK